MNKVIDIVTNTTIVERYASTVKKGIQIVDDTLGIHTGEIISSALKGEANNIVSLGVNKINKKIGQKNNKQK